jgi:lipopolysaccharide export system protein LptA
MGRRPILGACLLLSAAACALAAEPGPPPPKKQDAPETERLQVWADRIVYNADSGKFVFTGQVLVLKGNQRIDCTEMEGAVDPKTQRFMKVLAKGKVQLSTVDTINADPSSERPATTVNAADAWRATCTKADYDLDAGKIVMNSAADQPRPQIWRAQGNGEADTIIFYPNKGEYELIGNPVIRGEIPTGPAKPATRTGTEKPKEAPKGKEEPPAKEAPAPAAK